MPVESPHSNVSIPKLSLYDFFINRFRPNGDAVAMIDNSRDGKSTTFKEIEDHAQNCAGFLYKKGLRKGDSVALCIESCIEFPMIILGILACGATAVLYPHCTKDEMLHFLVISKPKMAFVDEDVVDIINEVQKETEHLQNIFVLGNSQKFTTVTTILESKHKKDFPSGIQINPAKDIALMPRSSGTTGMPKCVMLTHENLVSFFISNEIALPVEKGEIYFNDRPLRHASGFLFVFAALAEGIKVIMNKTHDLENMLQAIEKYGVTRLFTTPPVMIRYVHAEDTEKYDTSSLRAVTCGGASISPEILKEMGRKLNTKIIPLYAATETGVISYNTDADSYVNSVGTLLPNFQAMIVDIKTGLELGVGEDGEILVKSPAVTTGYFLNEEANKNAFNEGGWFCTGDLGHFDDNGRLYVTARIKEIIKYQIYQVSPAELESVISKHPKVADVGVIGIPDEYDGELPKAFVVKKDSSLTAVELTSFLNKKLNNYKQLRGGVDFVDWIPKSALGKIQRLELKKMAGL